MLLVVVRRRLLPAPGPIWRRSSPTSTAWCCGTRARGQAPMPCLYPISLSDADRFPFGAAPGPATCQACWRCWCSPGCASPRARPYAFTTMLNYADRHGLADGAGHAGGPVGEVSQVAAAGLRSVMVSACSRSVPPTSISRHHHPVRAPADGDTVIHRHHLGTVNKIRSARPPSPTSTARR